MRYARKRFEKWADDAWETIPEGIRREFSNLVIVVEDEPTAEQLDAAGVPRDETLLGLYEGVPLDKRGWFYQMALPDRITLFQGPLERTGGDIRQAIYETLWHELAHHIGMNEREVRAAERRKFGTGSDIW
ncbi:MAG: metallopeptidase family protein [Bryobacterales bacterium]|nr:metallopeptidase family protein [Bryobacterales bacterium]